MSEDYDFQDLFVLDLANNHQGDTDHATRIIREVGNVCLDRGIRAALKFQFRSLDTFVHPAHQEASDNRHIPRFLSTRLTNDQYRLLTDEVRKAGLVTMSTPFDEDSLALIEELDIEIVKVASCSAQDWPLLEAISTHNRPVVLSTGGLTLKEIDDVVSMFEHRRVDFSLMHCIGIYPTPIENLELNQIDVLRRRYPGTTIGFSTHEDPSDLAPVQIAVSKGARILERHVGMGTDEIVLNAYSSTPAQVGEWVAAAKKAALACGSPSGFSRLDAELEAMESLTRGVFANRRIQNGEPIARDDVYFAMPWEEGQLKAGKWRDGIRAVADIQENERVSLPSIIPPAVSEKQVLFTSIHTIKGMLNEAKVALSTDFQAEFSHHYGLERFTEVGATIIDCVNRSYCKKLIILLPGQRHPNHFHKRKEETFQVLHGVLGMEVEGRRYFLVPGDVKIVQQGVWHEFWSDEGVIFEEISTTHYNDDSFYEDKSINLIARENRKTIVNNWGRYQI